MDRSSLGSCVLARVRCSRYTLPPSLPAPKPPTFRNVFTLSPYSLPQNALAPRRGHRYRDEAGGLFILNPRRRRTVLSRQASWVGKASVDQAEVLHDEAPILAAILLSTPPTLCSQPRYNGLQSVDVTPPYDGHWKENAAFWHPSSYLRAVGSSMRTYEARRTSPDRSVFRRVRRILLYRFDVGSFLPLAIRTNVGSNLIYTPRDEPAAAAREDHVQRQRLLVRAWYHLASTTRSSRSYTSRHPNPERRNHPVLRC